MTIEMNTVVHTHGRQLNNIKSAKNIK